MECTSPIASLDCIASTAAILFPLVFISWLVGLMVAALIIKQRAALLRVAIVALPLGFVSTLAIATLFAILQLGGLWELLVGPAVVVGECVGLARVAAMRAEAGL